MERISPLSLVGKERLEFDLYNSRGEVICRKGEKITTDFLVKICNINVFIKQDFSRPASKETLIVSEDNKQILKHKTIFSDEISHTLINLSKNMLKKAYDGENMNSREYNEATNLIVEEVGVTLEKIYCISQFKIFDEYLYSHTVNVSAMSCALSIILGLDSIETAEVTLGAFLHDIGKMFIPKDILNKPAKLDAEEYEIAKTHSLLGYRYIKDKLNLPDKIAKVALDHQEFYGGGGYPNNLVGKQINLGAQITAITDVYDALTSNKVYKRAVDSDTAVEILLREGEKRFNPYILSRFMKLVDYKNKKKIYIEDKDVI